MSSYTTWTPPANQCLAAGQQYGWYMREIRRPNDTPGAWTPALSFTVAETDAEMVAWADFSPQSRRERLHRHMNNEMGSLEIAAQCLADFPDAPWELRMQLARQVWDESRHVEALHRRATAVDPNISIATVYRTVRLFEESGILAKHDFGDGRARVEGSGSGRRHRRQLDDGHTGLREEDRTASVGVQRQGVERRREPLR